MQNFYGDINSTGCGYILFYQTRDLDIHPILQSIGADKQDTHINEGAPILKLETAAPSGTSLQPSSVAKEPPTPAPSSVTSTISMLTSWLPFGSKSQ